jgi:hypothetical protein
MLSVYYDYSHDVPYWNGINISQQTLQNLLKSLKMETLLWVKRHVANPEEPSEVVNVYEILL